MLEKLWNFFEVHIKGFCAMLLIISLLLSCFTFTFIMENIALRNQLVNQADEITSLEKQLETGQTENSQLKGMLDVDGRGDGFNETVVYVNGSGRKYHRRDCQYVDADSITMFLTDAERSGYSACSMCY